MSFIITKSYAQGNVLTEGELDPFKTNTETLFNTTKLTSTAINIATIADSIATTMSAAGANGIASALNTTGGLAIVQKISTTEGYQLQGVTAGTASPAAPFTDTFSLPAGSLNAFQVTASSGTYQTIYYHDSGTGVDTELAVTVTARNRPILIKLRTTDTGPSTFVNSDISVSISGGSQNPQSSVLLLRDGVALQKQGFGGTGSVNTFREDAYPTGAIRFIDLTPGSGTKVYKFQLIRHNSAPSVGIAQFNATALEL